MAGTRRPGPPPQPTEAKRRRGNPGHRPLPTTLVALAPVVLGEVVDPSDGSPGAELVRRLLQTAASTWVADPDRLGVLQLLHDGWNRRATLLDDIDRNGTSYASDSEKGGLRYYRRPEVVELESLEKRLTTWLSLLGLTPSDRSRLGVAEVKARSRLEDLRDRRRSRAG